jgi:hypothetical protein
MDDQVSAHKQAVSLFQRYGKGGDNDKLKEWAVQTLPTLQHHLDMAEEILQKNVGMRAQLNFRRGAYGANALGSGIMNAMRNAPRASGATTNM